MFFRNFILHSPLKHSSFQFLKAAFNVPISSNLATQFLSLLPLFPPRLPAKLSHQLLDAQLKGLSVVILALDSLINFYSTQVFDNYLEAKYVYLCLDHSLT